MLPSIIGTPVDKLPFQNLRLIADLLYFDGPLLSYFKDNAGQHYLYYWCDTNGIVNRWLVFRTTASKLNEFLTRQITLRELILSVEPNLSYLMDLDDRVNPVQVLKVRPSFLPEDYLPDFDTEYDASLTVFHDENAARGLIVLMQQEVQAISLKLRRYEQVAAQNPEAFRELLSTA
jgi:hypothetical protein